MDISINGDDVHIIEFYAPWCPHCQHFKPVYVELAREVAKRSISVNVFFHSVSCTLNQDTCATYEIEGYPTFLGYRGDGGKDGLDNIVNGNVGADVGAGADVGGAFDLGRSSGGSSFTFTFTFVLNFNVN